MTIKLISEEVCIKTTENFVLIHASRENVSKYIWDTDILK